MPAASDEPVDTTGIDRAVLLKALYDRARPQGMGMLQYDPKPMELIEAHELIKRHSHNGHCNFDYLRGRVMKIDVLAEQLDPWLYDRDNGQGAVADVVAGSRETSDV